MHKISMKLKKYIHLFNVITLNFFNFVTICLIARINKSITKYNLFKFNEYYVFNALILNNFEFLHKIYKHHFRQVN